MNVANLQLEGLIMAMAALNRALVEKGLLTQDDITSALEDAEDIMSARGEGTMPPANRDAVMFPIRLLQLANGAPLTADLPGFAELTWTVGNFKGSGGI
jgi:hypothetical protein